jgi:hypothetical protein
MPEFHQIDEFNFDSAFVISDNSASHSLGQRNLRKIRNGNLRVVCEPIQQCGDADRVRNGPVPVFEAAVRGDQYGRSLIATIDDFIQ